ncbi:MAG: hypothetical protein IJU20_07260 [Clostridia bacterium]|nr:hypothetical protein [Clostridia bacterium]
MKDDRTDKIFEILDTCGADDYLLTDVQTESAELFFVRHRLDTRRSKKTNKTFVRLYCAGTNDQGERMRGMTDVELLPDTDEETLRRKIAEALRASEYALNPFYPLPDASTGREEEQKDFRGMDLFAAAGGMAGALFEADTGTDSFLNSAEVFATRRTVRIRSSKGTDVRYVRTGVSGEYVVQSKVKEDVEMFREFSFDSYCPSELRRQAQQALAYAADRSVAQRALPTGTYRLILSGEELATVLSYYVRRAGASMRYVKYSTWEIGDDVQRARDGQGQALCLNLVPSVPYSDEGISMKELPLLQDGRLRNYWGPQNYSYYLGVPATGSYSKIRCLNEGALSESELRREPCLEVVSFSDFQMDEFSGHFGGEIRLGYLYRDGKKIPVCGGSVNGNLLQIQDRILLSTSGYVSSDYEGPECGSFPDVAVAGTM